MSNANVKISAKGSGEFSKIENAVKKAKSNAGQPIPIYKIDIDRLIEGYTRSEAALQEIANIPSTMTPQMQAYRMRAIAKKALGI